ncbi:BLUF domain-containing protein [Henriciella marina]|uniref:BLUF domain-containing protein n=1 Tax=Henriciella marina TaxID=453851 RepID=UPI000369876B|nr:BLUF domain-containing protein [Henriciella marina]
MFKLAYVSVATKTLSSVDLQNILESAITNNRESDVTGILLFNGTNFMQVIEGPQKAVEKVFDQICKDDRHRNVVVIYRERTAVREFDEAPMLLQIVPASHGDAPDGMTITKDIALFLPSSLAKHFRTILESFDTRRG